MPTAADARQGKMDGGRERGGKRERWMVEERKGEREGWMVEEREGEREVWRRVWDAVTAARLPPEQHFDIS